MTDDTKRERPNAAYKLSKPDAADLSDYDKNKPANQNITFYYNRERRLEKAPQEVKDLYASKKQRRFGFLSPLVADRPRAILFYTILLMCVMLVILGIVGRLDRSYKIDGNKIEIFGTKFEGTTLVVLRKSIIDNNTSPHTGAVDIAISPAAEEGDEYPVFYHRVFFSFEPIEEYRFAVPFEASELLMVLQTDTNDLRIRFNAR